jgi:hypothetical protein
MGDTNQKASNIVLQLLGNDTHNHNDGLSLHSNGQQRRIPSQFSIWMSALQHMRFSKALEGIHVSNNAGLLILFLSMGVWLFVVYAIRHHDPLAKQITTGARRVLSAPRQVDERVVSNIRGALPVRMTPESGNFYVPGSNSVVNVSEEEGLQINPAPQPFQDDLDRQLQSSTGPGAASAAHKGPFVDPRFGSPLDQTGHADFSSGSSDLSTPLYQSYQDGPFVSPPQPSLSQLNAYPPQARGPVSFGPSTDGVRLKMNVSR